MKEMSSGTIGIIGGADGPSSVYIAGKKRRIPLKNRIRNKIYRFKRNRAVKKITAGARTLEEVISYAVEKYGAVETEIPRKMYELKNDMDFYIYKINMGDGRVEIEVNYDKNVFGISYSGSKKVIIGVLGRMEPNEIRIKHIFLITKQTRKRDSFQMKGLRIQNLVLFSKLLQRKKVHFI